MKHKVSKQILSALLAFVMIIGLMPVTTLTTFAEELEPINSVSLSGLSMPVVGERISSVNGSALSEDQYGKYKYTVIDNQTADWMDEEGRLIEYGLQVFEAGRTYSISFNVEPKDGYGEPVTYGTFEAGASYKVVVQIDAKAKYGAEFTNDVTAAINNQSVEVDRKSEHWIEVEYDFGECPATISDVELNVTAPKEGNTISVIDDDTTESRTAVTTSVEKPEASAPVEEQTAPESEVVETEPEVKPVVPPIEEFEYKHDDELGGMVITKYNGSIPMVIIPDEIDGEPVVAIGERAFDSKKSLKSIAIADSVKSIDTLAFAGCKNLTDVKLSSSLETIGRCAFGACGFSEITLPESLKCIDEGAFNDCKNLKSTIIPEGIEIIEYDVFDFCTNLETVIYKDVSYARRDIPKMVKLIRDNTASMTSSAAETSATSETN